MQCDFKCTASYGEPAKIDYASTARIAGHAPVAFEPSYWRTYLLGLFYFTILELRKVVPNDFIMTTNTRLAIYITLYNLLFL